ncbi:hypothetical protein J6590_065670 [Homalodisca vitripennis]|nr:hypothetical protein J6590_065670 [Homalodisca vitripennis]
MATPPPAYFFRQKEALLDPRSTMLSVCPPPVHGRSSQLLEDVLPPRLRSGTSHRSAQLRRFAVSGVSSNVSSVEDEAISWVGTWS